MPALGQLDRNGPLYPADNPEGQGRALLAETLYLANLMVLPGVAFVLLAILFLRCDRTAPPLFAAHLEQTFSASLWAGILLVIVIGLIIALGDFSNPYVWAVVIVYFTVCHSFLLVLGILGLAKAMAGQCFQFPLVGRPLPWDCSRFTRPGGLL